MGGGWRKPGSNGFAVSKGQAQEGETYDQASWALLALSAILERHQPRCVWVHTNVSFMLGTLCLFSSCVWDT